MNSFKAWLEEPFRTDMSVMGWFFFFGMLLAVSVLWATILRKIGT